MTNKHDSAIIFLYTGEYGVVTDSSGLYYMRARYYDPAIKRFINQDVLTGSITDSPTLNRYAYVNGNPISLSDPFGLSPILNWLSNLNGHAVLDLLGMIPGAGFVFDLANAAWYAAEGNYTDAIMCGISALPGLGDAFGPMLKSGKAACAIRTFLHTADNLSSIGQSLYGMYVSGSNIANAIVDGENVSVGDVLGFAMSAVSLSHAAKDLGTSYCFVGDTPVWTSEGLKPIEDIQIGDEVLSEDETTGEIGLKKVYDISINETDEFYHIHVNGEEIVATGTHPFYVYKFGWTTARALKAGDVLVLSNGRHVVVEWVDHEITESPVLVYNFEVEDYHTYFVGESGILVHNGKKKCGRLGKEETQAQNREISAALEDNGLEITGGGGFKKSDKKYNKEEYLGPLSGKGPKGGNYVDITAKTRDGRNVRINTVDVDSHGNITQREKVAADRINEKIRNKYPDDPEIILIPKGKGIGDLFEELRRRGVIN